MGEKQLPGSLGHRILGSQDESSSPSTKGSPEFCSTSHGVSRHRYIADPGPHGSAGLFMEDQNPHSLPF